MREPAWEWLQRELVVLRQEGEGLNLAAALAGEHVETLRDEEVAEVITVLSDGRGVVEFRLADLEKVEGWVEERGRWRGSDTVRLMEAVLSGYGGFPGEALRELEEAEERRIHGGLWRCLPRAGRQALKERVLEHPGTALIGLVGFDRSVWPMVYYV